MSVSLGGLESRFAAAIEKAERVERQDERGETAYC